MVIGRGLAIAIAINALAACVVIAATRATDARRPDFSDSGENNGAYASASPYQQVSALTIVRMWQARR